MWEYRRGDQGYGLCGSIDGGNLHYLALLEADLPHYDVIIDGEGVGVRDGEGTDAGGVVRRQVGVLRSGRQISVVGI